ncbi:hypothetical protein [Hoeflea alexandrii]|uniref:hypothetical protein n=1 Tax=Hoeflea alexandrii TaxID=288436 RepID=UPI0022AFC848|nr:hypothetical protein [Hoeflea alexandrii]
MAKQENVDDMKKFLELVKQIDILRYKLEDLLPDLKEALEDTDEDGYNIVNDFIDNPMNELEYIGNDVEEKIENWLKEHT